MTQPLSEERRIRAYADGISFQQFVDSAQVNQDLLRQNFAAYELTEEEQGILDALSEPLDVLVLAHDWCGDVASNLPLFAKLEQVTGKINLHILIRDPDNQDIAAAYPAPDGKHRLPTYIFFNQQGEELGTFIERPAVITEMVQQWRTQFWEQHPEWNWEGGALSDIPEQGKVAWRTYVMEQRMAVRHIEKEAILAFVRSLVS